MRLMKSGKNAMIEKGELSEAARRAIAGLMEMAPSLTAYGNTNPMSYFRLVPNQEAPTNICWGDRNRSVLVRVPLGWSGVKNMVSQVNPLEKEEMKDASGKQTVEFRAPDGSADIYQLLAGLTVAVRHGLMMKNALEIAGKTYVDVNIFREEFKGKLNSLCQLPVSCWESANCLEEQRAIYEAYNVFPKGTLDQIVRKLRTYNDKELRERVSLDQEEILRLVNTYFHCG
jgi:glutamine synthetase